ncbi:MAG TPA: glycoside hydrolase family 30 beta sandwich domain-containing protein [Steroidobacteraceae bacterium]|jgi:glucosylceramidase|nr:glycoside hydrolase family 30 beta sandwich domain-containing protein [Steroidobacteraceae bacterium]
MRRVSIPLLALGALLFAIAPHAQAADDVQPWLTTTDRSHLLARETGLSFARRATLATRIDVEPDRRYQSIVGFGAAVTDASAWLIQTRLNDEQRAALLEELFGRRAGIGLSFTRISIGASDFSRSHYSLDDTPDGKPDPDLTHFSIEPNRAHLLPVLRAALAINPQLRIVASPWSPPGWMKTSGSLVHGRLLAEAQPALGAYLVRFSDAYAAEGVPLYALTLQNEPDFDPPDYPGMRLEAAERARIIGQFLGPTLAKRVAPPLILDWDHNWDKPQSPLEVLASAQAARFIAGVAWHCYGGNVAAQTPVHAAHPDKDAYLTECSGGEWDPDWGGSLRWFTRELIIGSTRGWSRGVVLWNLALDEQHGPHAGGCGNCRGVVTIDSATGAVTRNVEYYVLAHASRFVRPGARRIASTSGVNGLATVAFQNPDDSLALIVLNDAQRQRRFSVRSAGESFDYSLPAGAVATFVWTPDSAHKR